MGIALLQSVPFLGITSKLTLIGATMSKSELISKELKSVVNQAALICPISGLVVDSNLPPLPAGYYLSLKHPLVSLIPNMLGASESADWNYILSLPIDLKSGALLTLLSHIDKISYLSGSSAYATRLSIMATLSSEQITKALNFLKLRINKSKTNFSSLEVTESYLDSRVWDAFVSAVYKLDYFTANAESQGWIESTDTESQDWDSDSDSEQFLITPKTNKSLIKSLNSNCLEAFKDLEEFLPKATRLKAKSLVKELATFTDSRVVAGFMSGITKYFTLEFLASDDLGDALAAYNGLFEVVAHSRLRAYSNHLILDFDASPVLSPATYKAKLDLPDVGLTNEQDTISKVLELFEPVASEPKLTLRERIALKKATNSKTGA